MGEQMDRVTEQATLTTSLPKFFYEPIGFCCSKYSLQYTEYKKAESPLVFYTHHSPCHFAVLLELRQQVPVFYFI